MPIQLQNFEPLKANHYQLAETVAEKNAANSRQANLIAQQGLNQAAEAMIRGNYGLAEQQNALNEHGRQFDVNQQNVVADQDLKSQINQQNQDQQQFENDLAQRKFGLDAANTARSQANADRQFGLQSAANQRDQVKANREEEDYRQMAPFKAQTLAYARLADITDLVKPDEKTGIADVTPYSKTIAKIYGIPEDKYDTITMQGDKNTGIMQLYGYNRSENAATPLLNKEGNPLPFNYQHLKEAQRFVQGGKQQADKYMAIPEYDEMGQKTGVNLFDTNTGKFVNPKASKDEELLNQLAKIAPPSKVGQQTTQPQATGLPVKQNPQASYGESQQATKNAEDGMKQHLMPIAQQLYPNMDLSGLSVDELSQVIKKAQQRNQQQDEPVQQQPQLGRGLQRPMKLFSQRP